MQSEQQKAGAAAARVLLVDDDTELCQMLAEYLSADGFSVMAEHDGQAGIDAVQAAAEQGHEFDVMVLDITMPVLDGFETLRRLRAFTTVPVLMLTARGDETDRIVGLELGADDYLSKPFNPRELAARLRAILRRCRLTGAQSAQAAEALLELGDLSLDRGSLTAFYQGQPLALTATEFTVLEVLARNAGQVVTKQDLSERALGRRWMPYDRSLDTHLSNLRRKLDPGADGEVRIKTIRGRGYLLVRSGRAESSAS